MPDEWKIRDRPPRLADPEAAAGTIERFIQRSVADAGADGVVVNLSGGIDSSVSATLATSALGSERVSGLVLPTQTNRDDNIDDARQLAEELVIDHRVIELQPVIDAFVKTISSEKRSAPGDPVGGRSGTMTVPIKHRKDFTSAVGNVAARLRMTAAYFEANTTNALVLGTGNRTELLLGYFTKYGDGGVDILPIGDLYKSEVGQLAREIGVRERIITKQPTAGLWAGQADEVALGATYEDIDTILWNLRERAIPGKPIAEALEFEPETVTRFERRVERERHKRELPPSPADDRSALSFDRD